MGRTRFTDAPTDVPTDGNWNILSPGRPAGPGDHPYIPHGRELFPSATSSYTHTDIRLTLLTQIVIFWKENRFTRAARESPPAPTAEEALVTRVLRVERPEAPSPEFGRRTSPTARTCAAQPTPAVRTSQRKKIVGKAPTPELASKSRCCITSF